MNTVSLKVKYLLVLNGVILSMWTLYAFWNHHKTEQQFMQAELNSIKHLAIGLSLLVEHHIQSHENVDELQDEIESLLPHKSGLDIMLIDEAYIVRAATQKDRIGNRWFEDKIKTVFLRKNYIMTDTEHFHEGRRAIDITIGVPDQKNNVVFVVHMARWLDHIAGALNSQLISHGIFAIAMLIVVGIVLNILTYKIVLKPLRSMNDALGKSGWLTHHPELLSGNEIERVQAALNEAIGKVSRHTTDLERRLKRSERLAVIGQMGALFAHEIRNPLHIVRGTAEMLSRRYPETGESGRDIKEEVDRIDRLIAELLQYARDTAPRLEDVTLKLFLKQLAQRIEKLSLAPNAKHPPIAVNSEDITVAFDPIMLEQALTNLIVNALEAGPENGIVEIKAFTSSDGEVVFEVLDSGTGIASEDLEKAAEPFFTRKSRGTGLGLAVVEKIADLHEGSFELQQRKPFGTRAVFRVPGKTIGDGQ